MPDTLVAASAERPVLGFALSRVASFYGQGTAEQRESAASLAQMLAGLQATPPGAVEVEFLRQDAYLLGIRLFYVSVELEDYCLDTRARLAGLDTDPPEPELARAVAQYFPELLRDPASWSFDPIHGIFSDLGFKLDRLVTEITPRARGMYNHDREVMSDKAIALQEEKRRRRAAWTAPVPAGVATGAPDGTAAQVTASTNTELAESGWGVEFSTGLAPDDIPAGSFRPLTVGSAKVLITSYGGALVAISGVCSHQQAALAKGRVEGLTIECPRHGATFDLQSGEQLCPPFCQKWMDRQGFVARLIALATPNKRGGDLLRYPLRVENGEILLRI